MQVRSLFATLTIVSASVVNAEQPVIPEPFAPSRYDRLLEDSPFAVATPVAPVEKPEEPWAANLSLNSAVRMTVNGQEKDWVAIRQRGEVASEFTLAIGEDGPDGLRLVSVEWDGDTAKKAVVKKGDKEATLERNQAEVSPPPPPPQPGKPGTPQAGVGGNAGPNNLLGGAVRKVPASGAPAIPRPTAVVPAPAGKPGTAPQPSNSRQRIRVIESSPRTQ